MCALIFNVNLFNSPINVGRDEENWHLVVQKNALMGGVDMDEKCENGWKGGILRMIFFSIQPSAKPWMYIM